MNNKNKTQKQTNTSITDYILPQEGFVRQPVLLNILGISRNTSWRRIEEGVYPRPIKISPRVSAWRVKDIRALISRFDESENDDNKTT